YLQSDAAVKKISSYITKKVADRLEDIFKNNRAEYEEKWDNLKLFIEYGMLSEEKFAERAMKFCLLKNTDGKYLSLDEYKSLIEPLQKDKDGNLVYLYASDTQEQYTFIEAAKGKGYDVLLLDCPLDSHFVGMLETKLEKSRFMRVDADTVEKLIVKEDKKDPELDEQKRNDLSYIFEAVLPEENSYNVKAENLGEAGVPILITQSEWMRRYREMSSLGGGMNFYGEMPKSYTIGVNVEHPLIKKILGESNEVKVEEPVLQVAAEDASEEDKKKADAENKRAVDALRKDAFSAFAKENTLLHQVVDLALLGAGLLKGKDLAEFIKRSTEILA
ncbi:MAG: molecular chaperone HtpG, partial [Bacteroidales bacterium]|nr:molecular chaperone HtpG [Bacteroidales bacterium]